MKMDMTDVIREELANEPVEVKERRALFEQVQDDGNWKNATRPFATDSKLEADVLVDAINWFCGGSEVTEIITVSGTKVYLVTSKGYYHYIGA